MAGRVAVQRVTEKTEQAHIVAALRTVGAHVYVIGRPPRRDAVHKGTGIGIGLPDVLTFLPESRTTPRHLLWVEVKSQTGRLSAAQKAFRDVCQVCGIPHIVGGLDEVLAYLRERGYVTEVAHYRRRTAQSPDRPAV